MTEPTTWTVPDIDFLPERYRQQSAERKTNVWRIVVVVLFAGMLITTSLTQLRVRMNLEAELARIEPLFAAANLDIATLAQMQNRCRKSEARAELVAFLQRRWPATQLVHAVLNPLPETIRLRELHISREGSALLTGLTYDADARSPNLPAGSGPTVDRAALDLQELQKETAGRQVVVAITGTTDDVASLHAYLGRIGRHRMIAKAELLFIERGEGERSGEAEFRLKLIIRPPRGVEQNVASAGGNSVREVPHG